jgi:FkbM family methyltransferase
MQTLIQDKYLTIPVKGSWVTYKIPEFEKIACVPSPLDANHGTPQHKNQLSTVHQLEGFAELDEGDTVFDVGAYIGTFSILAAESADRVISIDPYASINPCLSENTKKYRNIEVLPMACWNTTTTLELNLSKTPNENSILDTDKFDLGKKVKVDADTVSNIANDKHIEKIDFLKLEGEGAEPEILEGAVGEDIIVEKISMDCSAERNGHAPTDEIVEILESNGYEYKIKKATPFWSGDIVYAVNNDS